MRREGLRRKKYMGVWRRWPQVTAVVMRPLPRRAAWQMPRKSQKCKNYSSLVCANARRRNWVVELLLAISFLWAWGTVQEGKDSNK